MPCEPAQRSETAITISATSITTNMIPIVFSSVDIVEYDTGRAMGVAGLGATALGRTTGRGVVACCGARGAVAAGAG